MAIFSLIATAASALWALIAKPAQAVLAGAGGLVQGVASNPVALGVLAGALIAGETVLLVSADTAKTTLTQQLAAEDAAFGAQQGAFVVEQGAFARAQASIAAFKAAGDQATVRAQRVVDQARAGLRTAQKSAAKVQAYDPATPDCPSTLRAIGDVLTGKED